MGRLSFLIGKWLGDARMLRGPGAMVELRQSEEAHFRLDGLVLTIEGRGLSIDGTPVLQAFGIVSFDDAQGVYRMRAFNDGRWLETEVRLLEEGEGITWEFTFGEISTHSVLRINEEGEWTERAEIVFGVQPPRTLLELTVRRAG